MPIKIRSTLSFAMVVGLTLFGFGCSLMKKTGIPFSKEQVNSDLQKKDVKTSDGNEWEFGWDDKRCFEVFEKDATYSDDVAEVPLYVASSQDGRSSSTNLVVAGKMKLTYKKESDKWFLDTIDSTDLLRREIDRTELNKFEVLQNTLCGYYKFDRTSK